MVFKMYIYSVKSEGISNKVRCKKQKKKKKTSENNASDSSSMEYSKRVRIKCLPEDITAEEIAAAFSKFGNVLVHWPHQNVTCSPPNEFAFLLFEMEESVKSLLASCLSKKDKYYLRMSSKTAKNKIVQIQPWLISNSSWTLGANYRIVPDKTILLAGIPIPLKAIEIATILNRLYGVVSAVKIFTDRRSFPRNCAYVTFVKHSSFRTAISARYIVLGTDNDDLEKIVEIRAYASDELCSGVCLGRSNNQNSDLLFCSNIACVQYYCEQCWQIVHASYELKHHVPDQEY